MAKAKTAFPPLIAALRRVAHAVCTDTTRPSMCGVLFERVGDCHRLVATDGLRLALTTVDSAVVDDAIEDVQKQPLCRASRVKVAAVRELRERGAITFGGGARRVRELATREDVGRFIAGAVPSDGSFVPYEQTLPFPDREWTFDRKKLLAAVRKVDAACAEAIFDLDQRAAITVSKARRALLEADERLYEARAEAGLRHFRTSASCTELFEKRRQKALLVQRLEGTTPPLARAMILSFEADSVLIGTHACVPEKMACAHSVRATTGDTEARTVRIAVDRRFLIEALRSMTGPSIRFGVTDYEGLGPLKVAESETSFDVIMPMCI